MRKLDAILQQLPATVERAAWASAVIAEANKCDATAASVATCVYNLAYLGLFPGAALGHAYFVPFSGKATLVIGYKGFVDLAIGSGYLRDVHTDVVCSGEPFRYWKDETGPRLNHEPLMERVPTRKTIVGSYCIYSTAAGGRGIRLCNLADIAKSDKKRDVWNSDYEAMCRKTAVIRAAKEWKLTGRLGHAIRIDEEAEREVRQSTPDAVTVDAEESGEGYSLPTE